ncbi:MAG: ABC transporter substrate-binding protein [Actinomycetes bacterium]
MSPHRSRLVGVVTLTGLAVALAGCGSSSDSSSNSTAAGAAAKASSSSTASSGGTGEKQKVSIMVGGLDKQIYLPAMLAKQLGYFDEQGLDVDLQSEPAGVDAETAMLSGAIDLTVGFYDHTIQLQTKGKTVESVVQFSQVPGEVELVNAKNPEVKSPADWAGKSVGITGAGSSTDFLTQYLAAKNGVDPSKVNRLAVKAGQTFVAAFQQGRVVSGMTTEPTITKVVDDGLGSVLVDMRTVEGTKKALGGLYPAACLYGRTDWVNDHKDAVQKLANAFVKTLQYINTHSGAEIADHMPADYYSGVGKDKYAKALDAGKGMFTADGVMPDGAPDTVLAVLGKALPDVAKADVDLSKTYTTEFVKAAS